MNAAVETGVRVDDALDRQLQALQEQILAQQRELGAQALQLRRQGETIRHQQRVVEALQTEIDQASRGLLEAHAATQAQSEQLGGCVTRVMTAERRFESRDHALRQGLEKRLDESMARYAFAMQEDMQTALSRQEEFERSLDGRMAEHVQRMSVHTGQMAESYARVLAQVEQADESGRATLEVRAAELQRTLEQAKAGAAAALGRQDAELAVLKEAQAEQALWLRNGRAQWAAGVLLGAAALGWQLLRHLAG